MELIPALKIGWLNGWMLICLVYLIYGVLLKIFPKDVVSRLYDKSGRSKRHKVIILIGSLLAFIYFVLIIFSPLKIGSAIFIIGISVYMFGLTGFVIALLNFKNALPDQPSTSGLYRISRHPQQLMFFITFVGICIAIGSWIALFIQILSSIFLHARVVAEEKGCLARYGESYQNYMKRVPRYFIFFTASLFLIIFSLNIMGQDKNNSIKISENLIAQKVMDNVFLITHYFPWDANCLLVVLPDDQLVLIDTPNENSGTKSLLNWIYDNYGDIKILEINTGFHCDNLGGNEYLLSQEIPIYGSDLTKKLVMEKGANHKNLLLKFTSSIENKKYHDIYKNLEFKPPDKIYKISEGLKLELGYAIFEIYYPGETHTPDNVVVYLHKKKILFGGCLIQSLEREKLGYIGDANMSEWPKAVKKVKKKFKNCRIVVPGHGTWGDMKLLDHTINLLKKFNSNSKNMQHVNEE